MTKHESKYSSDFVVRVNEAFHDAEGKFYETHHSTIFVDEVARWRKVGRSYLPENNKPVVVLDIGTGTGFVPLQIARYLGTKDVFICSDISEKMLSVCKDNVFGSDFTCTFRFLRLDGRTINLDDGSVDVATMNSVLHHIPDTKPFLAEIDRILKPGGLLIVGHEPNKSFYTHWFLWPNYQIALLFFRPDILITAFLRKLGLFGFALRHLAKFSRTLGQYKHVLDDVNARLLRKDIIKEPLSCDEIPGIVDIHSPTHRGSGLDISQIKDRNLAGYETLHMETYNYLGKASCLNHLSRWYDRLLGRCFREYGAHFLIVLRKGGGS
jgi:ubiquinone/menaquinone biosynthesis C-methylase UbiE